MKNIFKLFILIALVEVLSCYRSYKDYKLYDVIPFTEDQHESLSEWQYEIGIDFWRLYGAGIASPVLVAPERRIEFENFLKFTKISYEIKHADYEEEILKERDDIAENHKTKKGFSVETGADFSVYWDVNEMEAFARYLSQYYPQYVQMETLANSPEGRPIYALRVSSGIFGQKPVIAMECGMHAREWAAPPTCFYLLHRLAEDPVARAELLARVDWLIVPMQNPDGYEYSMRVDRMWRQNRRQQSPTCVGVDLNRNFAWSWRTATAQQPCGSLVYPGSAPFSEPESAALHNVVNRYTQQHRLYLSVHTYGTFLVFPWSYTDAPHPIHNYDGHMSIGAIFRNAILAATGTNYPTFNSYEYFGNINGSVDDHMIGANNATYGFTIELTNGFNFLYPEARIQALSEETFVGYRALGVFVGNTFY